MFTKTSKILNAAFALSWAPKCLKSSAMAQNQLLNTGLTIKKSKISKWEISVGCRILRHKEIQLKILNATFALRSLNTILTFSDIYKVFTKTSKMLNEAFALRSFGRHFNSSSLRHFLHTSIKDLILCIINTRSRQ